MVVICGYGVAIDLPGSYTKFTTFCVKSQLMLDLPTPPLS